MTQPNANISQCPSVDDAGIGSSPSLDAFIASLHSQADVVWERHVPAWQDASTHMTGLAEIDLAKWCVSRLEAMTFQTKIAWLREAVGDEEAARCIGSGRIDERAIVMRLMEMIVLGG